MNTLLKILSLLALIPLLAACEEVIELDLPDSGAQLVIEASLTNLPQPFEVRLSQSAGFYDTGNYPGVSDATVQLTEIGGPTVSLLEVSPGLYRTEELVGAMGKSYQLEVQHQGEIIRGTSSLLPTVALDSISYTSIPLGFQAEPGMQALVHFQDRGGEKTYLRFLIWVNGELQNNLLLFEDGLRDGLAVTYPLLGPTFQSGDELRVACLSMDRAAYEYFNTLANITGQSMGPGAAAPANPTTNLVGDALGYFAATGVTVFQTTVP